MRLFYESDAQLARLERDAEHWQYARLLLGDGWRSLSEYVYDRSYVYAAAVSQSHLYQLFIGRGGKYQTSDWWTPHQRGVPVPLYVTHWQPLPPGVDPPTHSIDLFPPADPPPSRPPEPVYEPGPATAELTPGPRALLVAMRDGAVLRDCGQRWSSWTVQRLGGEPEKLTARPVDRLRELAFIARDGVRPAEPTRWYEFHWHVTDAGRAWLAANARS